MDLPPGPLAPAVWQTIAWMARPGAFLQRVHARFGDPATIRTYWTEEPMVLFSSPDAVREVFRLDPAIAPAGQSWEFLRPFAGPHSILLLDGDEHLRERRLMQGPFHGERMRAFAPMIAELARAELATWSGRVVALERMRELTLEIILRVVFGARDDARGGRACAPRSTTRWTPFARCRWVLAMAVVRKDLGPAQPVGPLPGRGRALRRDAVRAARAPRRRRSQPGEPDDSMLSVLLAQRDEHGNPPSDRHLRDELVALLVGGHDSSAASLAWAFERLARHPAVQARLRDGDPAYLDAVVKEVAAHAAGADHRAAAAARAGARSRGRDDPGRGPGRRVPVAGLPARGPVAGAPVEFRPERWLDGDRPAPNPAVLDPVRRRRPALRRRPVRGDGDAGGAPRGGRADASRPARSPTPERARRSMLVLVPHRGARLLVR